MSTQRPFAAVYTPQYYAETSTPSMRKLPLVAEAVVQKGLVQLVAPTPTQVTELIPALRTLHDPAYVDAFLKGASSLASSNGFQWTPAIRDGVLAINAGQLTGAEYALREGIAANIAQGFHHATYRSGGGFCTFNGLALVAQTFAPHKVVVLDCDEHGGNGTEEFTTRIPSLHNYSINGSPFGCSDKERSISQTLPSVTHNFNHYRSALSQAFAYIRSVRPALVIYQAGVDCHQDDPLGSLGLTTSQLYERDTRVFKFCKEEKLPVLFVLAGGYQEPLRERLVPLHVQTFSAAHDVYSK